jgi:hypothetical protein
MSPILAISPNPLPASFSQLPHPGVELLLQTKDEVSFDRAVTERSKFNFWLLLPSKSVARCTFAAPQPVIVSDRCNRDRTI